MLCREEKQCALNDRIIKNGPRNENQRIATAFFSSLLVAAGHCLDRFALQALLTAGYIY
jgi:hypothetical protein